MPATRRLHRAALTLFSAQSLCLPLALPSLARADVVFSDASLNAWSTSWVTAGSCPGSASLNGVAQASGGNSGAFLQFTQGGCNQFVAQHISGFSWNPSTQGAFSGLNIAYDANWQSGAFAGWDTRIGLNALLRQNGVLYYGMYREVSAAPWTHFSADLSAADWVSLNGSAIAPDFSATGGLIEFGIATSNNCPGCYKQLSGGLDNFELTLHGVDAVSAVPEPTSLALVGLGVLGIAAARRRRKV